ncbi:rod shape-determining protein MreC [Polyangium jinanense]|uniref:Cell shape-determining protein MreC n=1 Tax=Polyangium jinanense TaxID=2829994 RepID=A0A9X3X331_9BACT|nr:rod shape-determining protein MreC [Polyangium jinanense]MDC3958328.1 rod shape-determining protein MreC [Polyangium jinanense]MDC3983337.1 rod shape-determining protein MreC [Polyangium jinanense]
MNFKRYRDLAIVLLALAVPFWFLRASMRDPGKVTGADKVIVRIATPLQYAAATLARGLSNIWGDYIYLVDVKEDNARIASQNARLRERVSKLEALEEENRRLRRLLDLRTSVRTDVVSAQVVGKNTNEFFRVARVALDRESRDVQPNLPVISPDGVVGTTLKVSGDTIDVRLVVDAGSGVDVVVQRTGARGFVRGTGDETKYLCSVEYVQRTDEVEVGDLLVTSGVGKRYPKGIPVGKVTQVVKRDFGIYQQVYATPAVDFSRLEEVLIVTSAPPEEAQPAPSASGSSTPRR